LKLQAKFVQLVGYEQLLLSLKGLGQPSDDLLDAALEMVCSVVKHITIILCLL